MLKWWSGVLLVLAVFCASADEVNEFFIIPEKSLRFIDRSTKQPIKVSNYSLYYETRFDCLDAHCKEFRGNSTSNTDIKGGVDSFKTLLTKIPRMPKSGPLTLTFTVPGVCRQSKKCSASISHEEFLSATEPVSFTFDYDEEASKIFRQKRFEAETKSLTEIEDKLGKPRRISSFNESTIIDAWKKFSEDFNENRKKLYPMSYTEGAIAKLGLDAWVCGKNLQEKIAKCEVHACIYTAASKPMKSADDLIIHGLNKAGNCAISLPGGKRFFVPQAELAYFYEAFIANSASGIYATDPCADLNALTACREKKMDLLFQLGNRRLVIDYVPVKIGNVSGK